MACQCKPCPGCKGSGVIWFSPQGKYLGQAHWDDLDTMEDCESCDGEGIDYCEACLERIQARLEAGEGEG